MTWFPDLGSVAILASIPHAAMGPHVRAIGWLSFDHPYPTGDTPPAVLERIKQCCRLWREGQRSLWLPAALGAHECEWCQAFMAAGNAAVPAGELLYVFPEMLHHYVEVHRYAPPAEFLAAIMAAPLPGTPEYHDAVAPFRELDEQRLAAFYPPGWQAVRHDKSGMLEFRPPEEERRMKAQYLEEVKAIEEMSDHTKWGEVGRCPKCGLAYRWDGLVCAHCRYRSSEGPGDRS
jgi:hypothetical protein